MTPTELSADELFKQLVELWKKAIDVQQHFNDIELRIRNFALTVLTAVLGGAGVAVRERAAVSFEGFRMPLGVWLVAVGLVVWLALYLMDRWWYHRFLYGAVRYAMELETRMRDLAPSAGLPEGLTKQIGDASPFYIWGWKVRSPTKIDLFYGTIAVVLAGAGFALAFTR